MTFSNSSLVTQSRIITNHCNPRNQPITGITIHHNAGVTTVKNLLNFEATTTRETSFNYCIKDYDVGLCVEEKNRAWTSNSRENDYRCVTIEVINSKSGGDWPISDKSMQTLIKLCADICKRNNIPKLYFDGTTKGTLTRHNQFKETNCPGPYIEKNTQYICDEVNKLISGGESKPAPAPEPAKNEIVVGSKVKVKSGAKSYEGKKIASFVYSGTYSVDEIKGDRCVLDKKGICTAFKKSDLILVSGGGSSTETKPNTTPTPQVPSSTIKVGDMVKVKSGAKSYEGKKIASFVYSGKYRVDELKGNRAVLDKKGICTAFKIEDLIKQ